MAVQHEAPHAVEVAGRIGMVCYGVVHLVIGWLAVQVALGSGDQQTDQAGAVSAIAEQPLGKVLLVLLAAGLVAYALWQFFAAAQGYRWVSDRSKRLQKRVEAGAHGVVAVAIVIYAVRLMQGSGGQSGDQQQQEFTAKLLDLPLGRLLVGLVALAVIALGVHRIHKGVSKNFLQDLDTARLPAGTTRLTTRLGQIGYPAKGVAIGIIGLLLGLAAVNRDPNQAGGLDKALHTLADQPFGTVLLVVVALGFVAYGAYCFVAARSQRT
ncbi:MAG TPA: DUF1206 domain-containing protein [Pseudonocardiaceae bacterium]